ncbi:hypothetical protein N825_04315 [Skermanella stibiiresistens SB22]|uniref:Uncharacterized protein n=1 Tax=Skermanella stibiiresistens SB22 TaxID=1385369 RepID=W9H7W9_9PROT|nr:hypothetical protein N825_04315 [Skermanella stibiiresistens SB22]
MILAVAGWSRASTHAGEAEALKGRVADLEGRLTVSQGQLTNAQGQLTTVQGQLASVTGERDALTPLTAQVASLGEEIDGFQVERSMMLTERNGIVQKLGAVTWARDVGDTNAAQLQRQVAALTSQRDALRPLVEEVDRLESLRANLLTERNELVQRIGGVAHARDIAEAKVADLDKGIQAARADRERVLADMAAMETAVGTKEELTEQVARIEAEAKEIDGQLANLTARREALNGEIAQGQQRVAELQQAADLASQNLAAIGNEVAQRSQALNTLRQQQQEATRQAEAAKAVFLDAEKQLTLLRDQMVNQAEVLRAAAMPASGGSDGGDAPASGSSQPTQ